MKQRQYNVVSVTAPVVDILAKVSEVFIAQGPVRKGDQLFIEQQSQFDEIYERLTEQGHFDVCPGGAGSNVIAGIASLGAQTSIMGPIGADPLGKQFLNETAASGTSVDHISVGPLGSQTACCVSAVTEDGERTMYAYYGIGDDIAPEHVNAELIGNAQILVLNSYLWNLPVNQKAFMHAVNCAKQTGTKVAFAPASMNCIERHRADFDQIIDQHVDILFINYDEARTLLHMDDAQQMAQALGERVELVYLTMGSKGALVVEKGHVQHVEAVSGLAAVDTTGAGDMFCAGTLYGLTEGYSAVQSAQIGAEAAAVVIQKVGARGPARLDGYMAKRLPFFAEPASQETVQKTEKAA